MILYFPVKFVRYLSEEHFEINEKLKDCILNHGSNGNPKTKEGKILQIAVKFNIIDKDFLRYLINGRFKGNKIEFLEYRANSAVKMLKKLMSLKF